MNSGRCDESMSITAEQQRFHVHLRTIAVFNEKPIRDGYKYTMTE